MLTCRRMTLDPHLSPLIILDPSVTETWSANTESNRRKHKQYPGRDKSRKELSAQNSFYKGIKANNWQLGLHKIKKFLES